MDKLLDKLRKNGMDASFVSTGEQARAKVLDMIPTNAKVGIGGSVTIRQLGLIEALRDRGNEVYDHWQPGLSKDERLAVAKKHLSADYFLSSSNALAMDGKLVNTDNTGNRVSALVFGPQHVIVVLGTNKIVQTVEEGIKRIKETAAPLNCQRRDDDTPCAKGKDCPDCNSPDRLCRVTSIIEKKTKGIGTLSVIIVREELGY
ncbi:MAG: lactate utilization protein [Desulfobacteraceae bacterium]